MIMSNLTLNRLIVVSEGETVYDETFHKGLNIIRGQNGSGKSTIVELIYYVLGAHHIDWKAEAQKCDFVLAEIEIDNQIISLKRDINVEVKEPPVYIFWGKINDATITSWEVYSMRRNNERESFSQILFRALNIPDSNSDVSLTMHQILRILYIDQLSPANMLMRPELFDPSTMREAVSRTLMGAYDVQLLSDENKLKQKKKNLEDYKAAIDNIRLILKENSSNMSIEELHEKIKENNEQIQKITIATAQVSQDAIKRTVKNDKDTSDLFNKMKKAKEEHIKLTQRFNSLKYDIIDSENFIVELRQREKDLNNSIAMRNYLPTLKVSYCPVCLNPVKDVPDEKICPLCQLDLSGNDLVSNALKLKNEIAFQIKESENLLEKKKIDVETLKSEISSIKKVISTLQTEIDSYSVTIETTEQQERDKSLFIKGNLSKEIEYLNKELVFQEKLKEDIRIMANLKIEISEFQEQINAKRERLLKNYNTAMNSIKTVSIDFIKNDFQRDLPKDELSLSQLNIDFENYNTFSISGRSNFAASSMVYVKNSILFAFFFASLDLVSMNYPRFIICDNIEDKGMEIERSHKFQLNLFNKSQQYKTIDHQMIITTSMIEPSLNNSEICVGEFYTSDSKSLKLKNR